LAVRAAVHLLHLGELVRGEDAGELLLCALVQGLHLLAGVMLGELAVAADGFHLSIAVGEDGFKPGSLVWG
jgi:hypothetical protein